MKIFRTGGRSLSLHGSVVALMTLLNTAALAQESPVKASPPPATAPTPTVKPAPRATPPSSPRGTAGKKPSLAPRPPGETPAALSPDPAVRATAGTQPAATGGDGTDGEEPLVLPNVSVAGEQAFIPKSAQSMDEKARLELALKANPGLRLGGPLAKLNHALALEMQKEAKEAAARAALTAHVENLPAMDEERAKEEVRLMREATARPNNDWRQRR